MSLNTRSRGYEFAEYEKEILFNRKNVGFVRYISHDGKLFSLDPSSFFRHEKNVNYYAESCDPPPENSFVEVKVLSEDIGYIRDRNDWCKDVLRKIESWKYYGGFRIT
jgi:hypothetical protein